MRSRVPSSSVLRRNTVSLSRGRHEVDMSVGRLSGARGRIPDHDLAAVEGGMEHRTVLWRRICGLGHGLFPFWVGFVVAAQQSPDQVRILLHPAEVRG